MAIKWSKIAKAIGKGAVWGLTFFMEHPEIIQLVLDSQKKAESKKK